MAYGACAIDGRSSKGGRARVTILRGTEGVNETVEKGDLRFSVLCPRDARAARFQPWYSSEKRNARKTP